MTTSTGQNVTVAFIDLATYAELDAFLYGGREAVCYFVRCVKKSNWFAKVPVPLRICSGTPAFGAEFSALVARSGDYVLNIWLRARLSRVRVLPNIQGGPGDLNTQIRWCRNFMHNLIKKVDISFNDLVVHEFDNFWLDIRQQFNVSEGKKSLGYKNMIGDVQTLTTAEAQAASANLGWLGTGGYLNLPLPFCFFLDSGVALPIAALPYNEVKINFELRDWDELLIIESNNGVDPPTATLAQIEFERAKPLELEVWATYAVIHNDERVKMGKAPRDIVIEQTQSVAQSDLVVSSNGAQTTNNIRLSHSVKALFWMAWNNTNLNATNGASVVARERSNYTNLPLNDPALASDPIVSTSLIYENTARFSNVGSDIFSLVDPWYWSENIPTDTGYHQISYALRAFGMDPCGSTNFSKINNATMINTCSTDAWYAGQGFARNSSTGLYDRAIVPQTFRWIFKANNWNVVRISGGALGLPVL